MRFACLGLLAAACNLTTFTANQTAPVLKAALPALAQESDLQLAREAAPGQLKTVEGFLLASPENDIMIAILAQGYCEYAFGFLETDILDARYANKFDEADAIGKRATGLYLRCMNYGLQLLGKGWDKALYGDLKTWEDLVKNADKDKVAGLFWVATGLSSAINLNRDDIEMVAYLAKAKVLFERVLALDPNFYNGGAHMALGMLYSAQSKDVGGDPEKGKSEFELAIKATDGKLLLPKVLMATTYGTVTHNQEFFHKTLVQVLETSPAVFPDQRLANEIAHGWARRYLAHEKELF
jgi:TRAP transporter TatT component family protein